MVPAHPAVAQSATDTSAVSTPGVEKAPALAFTAAMERNQIPPEADLVAALEAVAGADRQAFVALFEHFAPRLKGFFMKGGADHSLADELIQEVMLTVWRKAALYRPEKATPQTWIFTIARNKRIDLVRKARRYADPEEDNAPDPVDPDRGPERKLAMVQEARRLREALASLPADQQTVLEMSYFADKSHGEIAAALGIPLGTVKSRLRLGLTRLRSVVQEDDHVPN